MTPTEQMLTDRTAAALRQLIPAATGARRRRLEARLAEVLAYAAPAEVWCANDANPTHEVIDGTPLCSTCLWMMRATNWDGRRSAGRPVGPCPCECNSGGFCGGCGHAGCSGGINVR